MQLIGASTALAGIGTACRKPPDKIVPFVRRPEEVTPGNALHFATNVSFEGYGIGLLVESHEGRPTKIEGNPIHPGSLGAATALDQGLILGLYDDDRARQLTRKGQPVAWKSLLADIDALAPRLAANEGASLRFLGEPTASPVVADLRRRIQAKFPKAQFVTLLVGRRRRSGAGRAARVRPPARGAPRSRGGVGDPVAGRRLHRRGAGAAAPGACVLGAARAGPQHESPLRRRAGDDRHRFDGRPPAAPARLGGRRLRRRAGARAVVAPRLRAARPAGRRRPAAARGDLGREVALGGGARSGEEPRQVPGDRRPPPARRRARAGQRAQQRARQRRHDGDVERAGAARRPERPVGAVVAAQRHRRGQGRHAGDHRAQPGLHRAGRLQARRAPAQGADVASITRSTRTRPRRRATRWCRRRTRWSRGATAAPWTAPCRSSSR